MCIFLFYMMFGLSLTKTHKEMHLNFFLKLILYLVNEFLNEYYVKRNLF